MSFLCTGFLRGFGIIISLPSYYIGFRRPRQSATCTKYCRRICAEGRGGAPGRKASCRTLSPAGGGAGGRSPAAPAIPAPAGGLAFLLARLPCLHLFSAPLSPHPPSPVGKGETKVIFMQGASPLASPGAEPARRLQPLPIRCQAGGLPFLSPANPVFSLLFCLHPPDPLPGGKGGESRLFHARGFAPCIPAPKPEAALEQGGEPRVRRGVRLLPRPPILPLAFFSPPSPQPPSRRKGGESRLFHARGFAPCIPEG